MKKNPKGAPAVGIGKDVYGWLTSEARRRGASRAQVVRDAFRAYVRLEKRAVKMAPPKAKYETVSF